MTRKPAPILIPMKEVCALTSLSRTMVNRLRSQGRFPDAVELGDRRVAFVRSEVLAWIDERIAERVRTRRMYVNGPLHMCRAPRQMGMLDQNYHCAKRC